MEGNATAERAKGSRAGREREEEEEEEQEEEEEIVRRSRAQSK